LKDNPLPEESRVRQVVDVGVGFMEVRRIADRTLADLRPATKDIAQRTQQGIPEGHRICIRKTGIALGGSDPQQPLFLVYASRFSIAWKAA
jgi:hypothetical protein